MQKILFEQTCNIVLLSLLTITFIQAIPTAYFNEHGLYVDFGIFGTAFFIALIITGIARVLYMKTYKADGYTFKDGEFSTRDEREQMISKQATMVVYKMVTTVLIVALALLFICCMAINNVVLLKQIAIATLGGVLLVAMVSYTFAWIIEDRKY